MTTYSLSGFAAVFDLAGETVVSVAEASMDFVWFDGARASVRYDYSGAGLAATLTTANAVDAAVNTTLSLPGLGLHSSDEVFAVQWDQSGVRRETMVLARWIDGADLDGVAPDYAVFAVFSLAGTALPPIPNEAYFARFMLTQVDAESYAIPRGDMGPSQNIALAGLDHVSTSETDHVTGTDLPEELAAGAGADTLYGKGGDDRLRGEGGDDLICGGAGADTLDGGAGSDTLSYLDESGTGGVKVSLEAGQAGDTYSNRDSLAGFEHVQGSWQADRIIGDAGANALWGFDGHDGLSGGNGNDSLTGGAGNDTLDGGAGSDLADYSSDGGGAGIVVDLRRGLVQDSHGDIDSLQGIEQLQGTRYGDHIIGADRDMTLKGYGGADTISGAGGMDFLFGGSGHDWLSGAGGDDTMRGGDGDDTLSYQTETGGAGIDLDAETGVATDTHGDRDSFWEIAAFEGSLLNDVMRAAVRGSRISGAEGQDILIGRAGIDTLSGDAGQDTLTGQAGADVIDGGAGIDAVDYRGETGGAAINGDLGLGSITDTHGDVDLLSNVENVFGTVGRDVIRGDGGENYLSGGEGADQLYGMAGDDSLQGGAGDDTLGADVGDDTLRGGGGDDLLGGGEGHDWMTGDSGKDFLRAGPGDDLAEGGAGADALTGSYGRDTLRGGDGNDSLAGSFDDDLLLGNGGNDEIGGGDQNDTLDGASGNDTLAGGNGHDLLIGGSGNDWLGDGWGRDTVDAGVGDDTISAGPDPDRFTGGGGADVFVFANTTRPDADVITDFELGIDRLQVTGFNGLSNVPEVRAWSNGADSGVELRCDVLFIRLLGYDTSVDLQMVFDG